MSGWVKGKITVQTIYGPKEIDAEINGHFAVHEELYPAKYTVTHIQTGTKMEQLFPDQEPLETIDAAKVAAGALTAEYDGWDGVRDASDAPKRIGIKLRDAVCAALAKAGL